MSDSIITSIEEKIKEKNTQRDFHQTEEQIKEKTENVLTLLRGLNYSDALTILKQAIWSLGSISKVG